MMNEGLRLSGATEEESVHIVGEDEYMAEDH
jgi:hypothetical protein